MATNGRNLSKITKNMNAAGEFTSEAFSDTLLAASGPVLYDSDADVPIDGVALGSQAFVPSEGYLVRLTDEAWWVVNEALVGWKYYGLTAGYASGYIGNISNGTGINKVPFATDVNATLVGDLISGRYNAAPASSATHGYIALGIAAPTNTVIQKFSFVSEGTAVAGGTMPTAGIYSAGGTMSETHGYVMGGWMGSPITAINKYPFAADDNATAIANLSVASHGHKMVSTPEYALTFPSTASGAYQKFTFVSEADTTTTSWLSPGGGSNNATASAEYGYNCRNTSPSSFYKNSFASEATATLAGSLTVDRVLATAGLSSDLSGYCTGGGGPASNFNIIEKWPFSADNNATDVGDLTSLARGQQGNHV